jgi:N-acetylglucosamine-6-phosphate deacetylase
MAMAGISLHESLAMATRNPGRFVNGIGTLRPGDPADLVRFTVDETSGTMVVKDVFLKGERWSS